MLSKKAIAVAALALIGAGGSWAQSAESAGVEADKITVCTTTVLSGPNAVFGKAMLDGQDAMFKKVNKDGGINGRKLVVVSKDDGYTPDKAVANVKEMAPGCFSFVNAFGTALTQALLPVLEEKAVPLVGSYTGGVGKMRNQTNKYFFNVRASYHDEARDLVAHLALLGIKKVAVVYQNDAFGKEGLEGIKKASAKNGITVAVEASIERNSVDAAPVVKPVVDARVDAVLFVLTTLPAAETAKGLEKLDSKTPIFSLSPVGALEKELGEKANGMVVTQILPPFNDSSFALSNEFMEAWKASGIKEAPSYSAFEGYVNAKVFVEGLKRAGAKPTREGLVKGLEQINKFDMGGIYLNYSADNHLGFTFTDMIMITKSGKYVY